MQARAYIFSLTFGILFCYLNIHPLLHKSLAKESGDIEQTCSKSKCMKEAPVPEEKDCNNEKDCDSEGCNPFLPCSIGYCCYLVENFFTYSTNHILTTQKKVLVDDNRISTALSECWHPPEFIS